MTITYSMTAIILFIGLFLMLWDVAYKLKKSPHRKISLILIATTMFYVAMDCLWIVEYTSEEFNRGYYVILNTLFYLVYITMPYIWFLFAKHFSDSHLNTRKWNIIFALPWFFNLVLVILTISGQELLWTIGDAETRYTRGPMFDIFTNVCMFYYFFAVAALLTNMPAMTFSKDISTGKYLACNQSFAEYAHRDTPEGVVGLTDHEIFDKDTATLLKTIRRLFPWTEKPTL